MNAQHIAALVRRRFQEKDPRLPVLPETVIKVRALVQDESKGASDIAEVIGKDATLSSMVLRIANSARFNPQGYEIRSLPRAIQRLGGRQTLNLITGISAQMLVPVKNARLQRILRRNASHGLLVATAASQLAGMIGCVDPDEAFLAGMVFDIGVAAIISSASEELLDGSEEECLDVLKRLHREMGGRLLTFWDMPDVLIALASHHGVEADDRPRENLIDLIDVAQLLLHAKHGTPFDDMPEDIEMMHYPPVRRLGVTPIQLAALEIEMEDQFAEMQEIFAGVG